MYKKNLLISIKTNNYKLILKLHGEADLQIRSP